MHERRLTVQDLVPQRSGVDVFLWLVFGAALAVRLVLMPLPEPIEFDLTYFWLPWMNYGAEHGLAQLYLQGEPLVNYPPFFLSLLVGLGKVYALLVPSLEHTPLQSALIRLPGVAADMAVGALLYLAARQIEQKRGWTSRLPLLAAGLWLFNPAVIYVSSVWGQVDSIHTLWMLAALLAALHKHWGWSGLLLGLALLTKLQAIIVAPLLVLLAWWSGWRSLARWFGAAAVTVVAGLLPLWASGALQPVLDLYFGSVGFYPAMSMNAYNPWFIAHLRTREVLGYWVEDSTAVLGPITLRHLGLGLLAGYVLLVIWILIRRWRAPSNEPAPWASAAQQLGIFFAAGLLIFGFFMLATEMHERYILPALAPLALTAALLRPTRVPFVLLSVTALLNLIHVLPVTRDQIQLMETLPDIRIHISVANTALFVWWTWLFVRGKRAFAASS
ncbi:MAG TPA: glycosyltransferase 87 family protein [Anaerolineae bacterium]|nr:glycosyltransferase 87 family protein [Anaerolineae bacterium]